MSTDIGKAKTAKDAAYLQSRFIETQEDDGIPAKFIKIRCVCLKLQSWKDMYKCLYCLVFYCRECAEQHFGRTVEQYRSKPAYELVARREEVTAVVRRIKEKPYWQRFKSKKRKPRG